MAKFTRVSSIDASRFGECGAYVAANRYQLDDERPYLWKTTDCGAHWTRIDAGIAQTEFTRVVREDPARRGLLVAGTERGVWYSADDGAHWQTLRLNLPMVPVHDLTFKDGDIVLATHGRSFYIMDDITTLEQMSDAVAATPAPPALLASGTLRRLDPVHYGSGRVTLSAGGAVRFLRFENVSIAGAPNMFVYLSDRSDGRPGTYTDLGALKATDGSFNYEIPASVELSGVHSVVVWCRAFSLTVTYAALQPEPAA